MSSRISCLQQGPLHILENHDVRRGPVPDFLRQPALEGVQAVHAGMPGHASTPLVSLPGLSRALGLGGICIKDESSRFGLGAFKGLGSCYAVFRAVCQRLGLDPARTTPADLRRPCHARQLEGTVFVTATDGNHGRGVAWAAAMLGCAAEVYMPAGSAEVRARAIREAGRASVTITDLSYDDTVRLAACMAREWGGLLVQDTSWPDYEQIPAWIVQGYTTLAVEAVRQMAAQAGRPPSHIFLQAGVGAMAGGVLGCLLDHYAHRPPQFVIVEPASVACIHDSLLWDDGLPHAVAQPGPTIMAGLNCGEPCPITWPLLRDFARFFMACPDYVAAEGMRALARPLGTDRAIIAGESGAAPLGALLHLMCCPELEAARRRMGLDEQALVLLVNTEGNTDPALYAQIVEQGAFPSPCSGLLPASGRGNGAPAVQAGEQEQA